MLIDIFKGERVYLAAPRDSDKAEMERWHADSQYLRLLDTEIAYPPYAEMMLPDRPGTVFDFRVRLLASDELIGFTAIHSIEWNNQCGIFSIGIGEQRGKGYGSEALRLTLRYAFCELNLHRVSLEVIEYNEKARRLYEHSGFRTEGVLRESVYRDGRRFDKIIMGITRPEWDAMR